MPGQATASLVCTLALFHSGLCTPVQPEADWWKTAVIYEIYPRSFADSNGDGVGDLDGITAHLDYLKELGVDAIWITPFYPSPQVDFGYDISNYTEIDPQYGTMAGFERMVAEAQKRGIRVINDLVLNHTSDQHPWFKESDSSRKNSKSDWYVWHDGKLNHEPPNNWQSIFGHSAWQWEDSRKQYYYHAFYKEQPDLNWRNPAVKRAMHDVLRFWMDKGVAGFRLDAVPFLYEDSALRDESYLPGTDAHGDRKISHKWTENQPELHDSLRELRRVTNEYPGRILIGEAYLPSIGDIARMYGRNRDELQLPMDFQYGFLNRLSASAFRQRLVDAETRLNGNTPLFVFENHDNSRSINRYGNKFHNGQIARLLATALLTPRAASLVYYGQELGMIDNPPKRPEDARDPEGRDAERTPMQWNARENAGFTTARKPWLPVAGNYQTINVENERANPDSLLNYYKKLIRLRKENPQLRDGDFVLTNPNDSVVLSFARVTADGQAVLVALNFTGATQSISINLPANLPGAGTKAKRVRPLLASFKSSSVIDLTKIELPPFGSFVGQVVP